MLVVGTSRADEPLPARQADEADANRRDEQSSDGLPYAAAVREAEAAAPTLRPTRARAGVAAEAVGVARMWTNPQATITTSTGNGYSGTVTIPLPITRYIGGIRAAESGAAAIAAEVPVMRLDARLSTALAWCDLWLAERSLAVTRETEARAVRVLEAAQQRLHEGTGPQLDVTRAAAERARTAAEVLAAESLVVQASATLTYWLGRDAARVLHTLGDPPNVASVPAYSLLVARLDDHAVFARSRARVRAAEAVVAMQRGLAWPRVGVQLGAQMLNPNPPPLNSYSAGVVFDVPIFNLNGPAVAQAERGVLAAEADAVVFAAQARADLAAARAVLVGAMARADAATVTVLPTAESAANLTRDAYATGAVDLTTVVAAEQALALAKQAAYVAVAQRGRALAMLERALGGEL